MSDKDQQYVRDIMMDILKKLPTEYFLQIMKILLVEEFRRNFPEEQLESLSPSERIKDIPADDLLRALTPEQRGELERRLNNKDQLPDPSDCAFSVTAQASK
jgi:hypothetical protein